MKLLAILAVLFMPLQAFAQDKATFCKTLTEHIPDEDVNYKPGREDVIPADIDGGVSQAVFDPISIPIQVDLLEYMGLDAPEGVILEPYVAQIDVFQDGRVLYNGQDISKQTMVLCSDADGQGEEDALNSQSEKTENIKEDIERAPLSETEAANE